MFIEETSTRIILFIVIISTTSIAKSILKVHNAMLVQSHVQWCYTNNTRERLERVNKIENDRTETGRKMVTLRIDAHISERVTEAKKFHRIGKHKRDNDSTGSDTNGHKKDRVQERKRKGGGGNGRHNDNTSIKKSSKTRFVKRFRPHTYTKGGE